MCRRRTVPAHASINFIPPSRFISSPAGAIGNQFKNWVNRIFVFQLMMLSPDFPGALPMVWMPIPSLLICLAIDDDDIC
jgi:hypothetical protein